MAGFEFPGQISPFIHRAARQIAVANQVSVSISLSKQMSESPGRRPVTMTIDKHRLSNGRNEESSPQLFIDNLVL